MLRFLAIIGIAVVSILSQACSTLGFLGWEYTNKTEFEPSPVHRVWFEEVEECIGIQGSFDDITWYRVKGSAPAPGHRSKNDIMLQEEFILSETVVKHEIVHYLMDARYTEGVFDENNIDKNHPLIRCAQSTGNAVEIREQAALFTPSTIHEVWFNETLLCANLPAVLFENIQWFLVPAGSLMRNNQPAYGVVKYPFSIYLEQDHEFDEVTVKDQFVYLLTDYYRSRFDPVFFQRRTELIFQCARQSEFFIPPYYFEKWFEEVRVCCGIGINPANVRWKLLPSTGSTEREVVVDRIAGTIAVDRRFIGSERYIKSAMLSFLVRHEDWDDSLLARCLPVTLD